MDREGAEMRQQMDETMAGLTGKLEDLGDHLSGTVKTVQKSVNSVREAFDVKLQVRRNPLTALAGAAALGFFFGFQPDGNRARHNGNSVKPAVPAAPSERPPAAPPGWLAHAGETFKPEIAALRGVAVGTLLGVIREAVTKQAAKPTPGSAEGAPVSDGPLADQGGTSR